MCALKVPLGAFSYQCKIYTFRGLGDYWETLPETKRQVKQKKYVNLRQTFNMFDYLVPQMHMHFYYEAYQVQGFVQRKIISNVSSWTILMSQISKYVRLILDQKMKRQDTRLDENASKKNKSVRFTVLLMATILPQTMILVQH